MARAGAGVHYIWKMDSDYITLLCRSATLTEGQSFEPLGPQPYRGEEREGRKGTGGKGKERDGKERDGREGEGRRIFENSCESLLFIFFLN